MLPCISAHCCLPQNMKWSTVTWGLSTSTQQWLTIMFARCDSKLFALQMNHLLSKHSHSYADQCKHVTAHFNIFSWNEVLAIALQSFAQAGACHTICRQGQGSLNHSLTTVFINVIINKTALHFKVQFVLLPLPEIVENFSWAMKTGQHLITCGCVLFQYAAALVRW